MAEKITNEVEVLIPLKFHNMVLYNIEILSSMHYGIKFNTSLQKIFSAA